MPRCQNGWPAFESASAGRIQNITVAGVTFPAGVRHWSYVAVVLTHVATQYHHRVEKLRAGWCWGYNYRPNRNDPNSLSNHSGGYAIDINAPLHPNGVATYKTFSQKQINEVHEILRELNSTRHGQVVRWGGDYTRTVDAMHFEIVGDEAAVIAVGKMIQRGEIGRKIGVVDKVKTAVKPKPSKAKARLVSAPGHDTVNIGLLYRGHGQVQPDIKQLQRVLNAWYPHDKIKVDGLYGNQTYALLDRARKAFGITKPVSDRGARRATVRKLGFKTVG